MRSFITPLLVAPLVLAGGPVFAQSNPTAAQIIQSLKPSGNLVNGGTRGIRLAAPPPSMTAPQPASHAAPPSHATAASQPVQAPATNAPQVATAKPMTAPPSEAEQSAPSVNLTVNFALGSAELTQQARSTLNELGRALSSHELAGYHFRIEGHTDTVGSPAYNLQLSKERANAVVNYLTSKFGVQPARLQAVGMGEAGLLVQTPPQTPEPRNRRVHVVNIGT